MHILSWRTVSALTRVLFGYWFPSLLHNSGNKHQNHPLVSAETVRHSSTYIIIYISFRRRFGVWDPDGFESCIQQRKTTCLLSIRISLACARASKLTTTRQHSTQSVGNMPPPSPRHLLPHVLQIMPRNPKYDQFQPKGHHNEENPQSATKMPVNPKFYPFH